MQLRGGAPDRGAARQVSLAPLPEPERVGEDIIARCRREVEGSTKARVRRLLVPLIRRRLRLAELGEGFQWGPRLRPGAGSRIGRYVFLAPGFEAQGPVVVGDLAMIGTDCWIVGNDHRIDIAGTPTRLGWPCEPRRPTVFGADVWVGARVTIREGVTIGAGAVVAAAATVTRDVPPYTIVAGTPARPVRDRFGDAEREVHDRRMRGAAA